MALTIIQNTTGYVAPNVAIVDTGWTISGIYAVHTSCNSGYIKSLASFGLVLGRQYSITYTVDNYISGGVKVVLGTSNGVTRTANGTYTETLICAGNTTLSFFSDGSLRISILKFYDTQSGNKSGNTISFNEGTNQWGGDYSWKPEIMIKFLNQFFTMVNGELWLQDNNPVRNNFYGQQYPSKITFIVNQEFKKDKLFFNFRISGKGAWSMPTITTVGSDEFPNGMVSRLKKGNFKLKGGKLWADVLNDITDPNFATISDPDQRALKALFNGRKMQGGWLIVEMECNDTGIVEVSSVETYFTFVQRDI